MFIRDDRFHRGSRTLETSDSLDSETVSAADSLIDQFVEITTNLVMAKGIRPAVVRAMLPCNITAIFDQVSIIVVVERARGMPSSVYVDSRENRFSSEQIREIATLDVGYEDSFFLRFPMSELHTPTADRSSLLTAIADRYVSNEVQRMHATATPVQFDPIFGEPNYKTDPRLVFVLMPFEPQLTDVYKNIVKQTIEGSKFNLVCRRADDYNTNTAIMQDIWKAICEARIVIADLSGLNPNVMYELGIAHTVGKDTILLYQRREGEKVRFPFDLAHIRRIEYDNNAAGGKRLERSLLQTLEGVLEASLGVGR